MRKKFAGESGGGVFSGDFFMISSEPLWEEGAGSHTRW